MSGVKILTVQADEGDLRLDRWFRRRFAHVGQGRLEKMCRKGEIRVDGSRVRASARLLPGQNIRIPPLPDADADADAPRATRQAAPISNADAGMIRGAVIYRDEHILALDKPPGLAVQGGSKQTRHVDGLAGALRFGAAEKPRLVHRLDKDTSGVMLLARSARVAAALTRAFRARQTRKIYWAAVAGLPSPAMGTIRFGLVKGAGHGPHGAGEKMRCIHPGEVGTIRDARRATSDYAVLEHVGQRAAWVALVPITGRTHQLRAHMAEIGHPIVGDGKYGTNRQTNEGDGWGAQLGGDVSRKLHLHARSLAFDHPVTGARVNVVAPLPEHMQRTWDLFSWDPADVVADPFGDDR
ncbi:MAG: RluA family pseudouridine synthase [Paracoccaceae bacterium]